jgi:antitoxin (DNA-binding transcriptional repressor) of toxin-antitoxin stability system
MKKNVLKSKKPTSELLSTVSSPSYAHIMTRSVDVNEAGSSFPKLADEALAGEEVIFSKDGNQVLKLVRLEAAEEPVESTEKIYLPAGAWAHYDPDFDFDAWDALDEDVRKLFKNLP